MTHAPKATPHKKVSARTKTALWLLISPTALFVVAFFLFALINLVFNPTFWPAPDTEPFAPTPVGMSILNVILFFVGSVSAIAWLPGIIIGAVLLATAPKKASSHDQ